VGGDEFLTNKNVFILPLFRRWW